MSRTLLLFALLAALAPAGVLARQDPAAVQQVVEDFLRTHTRGLPGTVSFEAGSIDPHNKLAPCPALEAYLPPGARAWGRTSVGVRCRLEGGWSLFVPVQVRVVGTYLVAARPLRAGSVIGEDDLASRSGDLAALPASAVFDAEQALGRSITVGLAAGRPLRADLLRRPLAVQQGQSVKVVSRGPGFQVSTDGRALNGAADGQIAQVRTANGHTVSGVARAPGLVEVNF